MLLFGCLLAFAAAIFPRLVLILAWFFSERWDVVWGDWFGPLLGIIFVPYTTIFYMLVWSPAGIQGFDWAWLGLGLVLDLMKWGQIVNTRKGVPGYPKGEVEPAAAPPAPEPVEAPPMPETVTATQPPEPGPIPPAEEEPEMWVEPEGEPETEPPTEPETELPTEPETELPTGPEVELPTELDTEPPTGPETEQPAGPEA